ncbi:MAG: 50S ribosomal protein L29 [Deltaproteobacteria bacterium RBG_19FT_COMBO_46_9]|nr:MAG: 50S ribosomal protein L29 [Deltaproteobacteria bacterium RBG_19FT_COMBO_46_9]
MKAQELRALDKSGLKEKITSLGQELFNLRFQKATGQLANTALIGKTKRDLARAKTLLKELENSSEIE